MHDCTNWSSFRLSKAAFESKALRDKLMRIKWASRVPQLATHTERLPVACRPARAYVRMRHIVRTCEGRSKPSRDLSVARIYSDPWNRTSP